MEKSFAIRASKIFLISGIGCLALLVASNNVLDYQSNFQFVQHVMLMDTVYPGNVLKYRAITEPLLHSATYILIIFSQFMIAVLCLLGALQLLRHIRDDGCAFNKAKSLSILGLSCGFALWFFGFIVVGAEWFCMWQSPDWNGQESSFRFVVCIILVLIYTVQSDKIG
jgi:predicted small integral membrane protein